MADPIAIIGTAGAVANIIDVLGKTIGTIGELRRIWQDADLAVLHLESQLAALNTALKKIKDWTESSFEDPHHQLVMDLDRCVVCCRILISKIDAEVSRFQVTTENRVDVASKFRLLLKTRDFEHVQRMIDQQTGALTLLLTACNTTILSEQKAILEQPQTRGTFKKMQSDTDSLYVHRDVDSLMTSGALTSIRSSKRSLQFEFDPELFISRIYQRWIRGSVKRCLQYQQSDTPYSPRSQIQRSKKIDRELNEDSKKLSREFRVLLLGSESRTEIVKVMKSHYQGYTRDELYCYRPAVFRNVCDSARSLVDRMRQFEVAPESDKIWEHADFIAAYVLDSDPTSPGLDPQFKTAVESILESPYYSDVKSRFTEFYLPDSAEYLFAEIARIAEPDYLPTEEDILRVRAKTTGIHETRFEVGGRRFHMFDIGEQRSERRKWIHCFENVAAIIFVVDLDSYDQVSPEEPSQTRMMESLLAFDSIVSSRWFMWTPVLLLLANVGEFKRKFARSPLGNYFPDYTGGNDVKKGANYILRRFQRVNRAHLYINPHLVEVGDISNIRLVLGSIERTIVHNVLHYSGMLPSYDRGV